MAVAGERKPYLAWHGHFSTRYPQQRVYFGIARSNRLRFSLEETWRLSSFATILEKHKSSWNAIEEEFRVSAKSSVSFQAFEIFSMALATQLSLCGLKIWEMTKPTTKIKRDGRL